ncbi:MAG: efflux RND transporter periplasmic adaptor subunit [Anaerolineae bacterium]|nr:efflux RND transporter periplasmic adaptor subunit [Anaerolineae bacterium]
MSLSLRALLRPDNQAAAVHPLWQICACVGRLFRWRAVWWVIASVFGGVLLYFLLRMTAAAAADADGQPYQVAIVRRGDLVSTSSGTGQLVAGNQISLSFSVSGTLAQLNVQVGDRVSAGDVLASIEELHQLELTVATLEGALKTARRDLEDLYQNSEVTLAQARQSLAEAEAAYESAKNGLIHRGDMRCSKEVTEEYYYQYLQAQSRVSEWEGYLDGNTGYGTDFVLTRLVSMREERDLAYLNWQYCQSFTEQEIRETEAALALAEANMRHAKAYLQQLEQNGGLDMDAVELAETRVKNAEMQLAVAQHDLEGAQITAPVDGVMTAISAAVGERVGTATVMVIADLQHPHLKSTFDETDLSGVAAGCPVQVVFDALPDRVFAGTVAQVLPQLVESNGQEVVQADIIFSGDDSPADAGLPLGANAALDVTCTRAQNALLVPLDALHLDQNGNDIVFVLTPQGSIDQRAVEVGVQDLSYAEIRSGLSEGEQVVVGDIQT